MKNTIESVNQEVSNLGWKLITEEYKNLDTEMEFQCPEGHKVYTSLKRFRSKQECPLCKMNPYKDLKNGYRRKTKETRVLALDQATNLTGYSIFDGQNLIKYGIYKTNASDEAARIAEVKNWVDNMISNWKPDRIQLEDIQLQIKGKEEDSDKVMGVTTYKVLAHLQGVLINLCFERNIPCEVVHVSTWREYCKIKGKTRTDKKRNAQLQVKEWYDITVSNFEYNFIVDKAYTEENFYIIVRDVYGHEKKIPTNLYDILKLNISKIDESERVYSGTGINPIYDSRTNGKCGYPYESYKNLETTNTNELMKMARNLENGETVYEYRWPDGRYSSIDGTLTDYTTVTNGDTIGEDVYRWVTITKFGKNSNLEPIVLNEASGFTMKFNIAEDKKDIWVEDKYSMTTENIIIQAKTFDPEKEGDQSNCSWVDCNSPYDGFAEVGTEDGQAGMYAGSSNATKKRVTFGKSTYSGKLAIRVGIKRTSNLSFESISIEDII